MVIIVVMFNFSGGMMKIFTKLIFFFFLTTNLCFARNYENEVLSIWHWLDSFNIGSGYPTVFFDKNISQFENDIEKDQIIFLGSTKISKNSNDFNVSITEGPSHDPTTILEYNFNGQSNSFSFRAHCIIIPGTGFIYTIDSERGFFKEKRKYKFINGEFIEIKQPLNYIGSNSVSTVSIKLFESKNMKNEIGIIPKDSELLIIGGVFDNNDVFFLLQSKFGLVGWHKLQIFDIHNTSIKGIYGNPD